MQNTLSINELTLLSQNVVRWVKLKKIVDGDTIQVTIDHGFDQAYTTSIRFYRIDTPETRGTERLAGLWAKKQLINYIGKEKDLLLHSVIYNKSLQFEEDRYGRVLADVYKPNGDCINLWMLTNSYGWPTDEKGKILGARDITRLRLPEAIINQVLIEQK